jgi:hypothetical protein
MDWEHWVQFGLTFLAILVALFGKEFVSWLKRPDLKLDFDMRNKSFFHERHFGLKKLAGKDHYSKGVNCLFMVSNPKKKWRFMQTETAKGVEVKVTYIFMADKKYTYHPTNLNWSGEMHNKPVQVQIIAGSHQFLDFLRFFNYENDLWIFDPNLKKSAIDPTKMPNELQGDKIYFEPWFVGESTGITRQFSEDGEYKIHFVINGENCGPYKYIAIIKWCKSEWDKPKIEIVSEK